MTGDIIQISEDNVQEHCKALEAILYNIATLRGCIDRYPIFLDCAGLRFCMDKQSDLDELMVSLECKIAEYKGNQ
jgi:hypothetical protein